MLKKKIEYTEEQLDALHDLLLKENKIEDRDFKES